jgi:hypothetical protein
MATPYGQYTARTGAEFYQLIEAILSHRSQQGPLPPLDTYLSALWHLASQYQHDPPPVFSFGLLAEWFDRAFDTPPMPYDWAAVLKRPYVWSLDYESEANTEAYRAEIRTYAYFERVIKRQIEELKRGYANVPWERQPTGPVRWENGSVETYLERAVSADEGWGEPEETPTSGWYSLAWYLGAGQWTE